MLEAAEGPDDLDRFVSDAEEQHHVAFHVGPVRPPAVRTAHVGLSAWFARRSSAGLVPVRRSGTCYGSSVPVGI